MALVPELGFVPDLGRSTDEIARGEADVPELPEQPDRRDRAGGVLRARGGVRAARTRSWWCTTSPTRRSPTTDIARRSFLQTPGAKDVGVEVFSLSKGYNMTGWRCGAVVGNAQALETYWRLKTNIDSGMFDAVQLAGVAALSPDADAEVAAMSELYLRRRDLVCEALPGRRGRHPAASTIYVWAPVPEGYRSSEAYWSTCSSRPRWCSRRARSMVRRGGLVQDLADDSGRAPRWRR